VTSYAAKFNDIQQSLRFSLQRQGDKLERLVAQLRFADQLCAAYPDRAEEWQARILEAGHLAQEGLQGGAALDDLVALAEEVLAPIGQAAKAYTLLCVSHAHIDMNWQWSWPETVAVTNDTFRTMLTLMEEFPEFIFTQSQASVYDLIERYNPAMFDAIRQRVGEGCWEVTASQWVEGDKNMSSGESLSRHLLYARAYFQEKFGLAPEDVEIDFEPDTFGHPATLPTILTKGGVKYYYHCRGSHGPHLYWWIGPDDSRLLALNDIVWYMCAIGPEIADPLIEFSQATGLKFKTVLYGVGDHGGGPTRRDLRRIAELDSWPVFPNVKFSTLHDFFRRAEREAQNLPEIVGERNFVFPGCYTSQARIKGANRHGENLLYAAEAAAAIGERVAGVSYPRCNLEAAWKHVLFNQFHDILPGSGVRDTRHHALGMAQETQAAAGMARSNALRALSTRVNTAALRGTFADGAERAYKDMRESDRALGAGVGFAAGGGGESASSATQGSDRAFLVFNPLPYAREEVIEATLWDTSLDEEQLVVTGEGQEPHSVQVLEQGRYWGHEYLTVAFPVRVPALGYRVVCVSDRAAAVLPAGEPDIPEGPIEDPWKGIGGAARLTPPPDYTLENEFLRVRLDPASGGMASLFDKRAGHEWVPEGGLCGILQYSVEANQGMTAWMIGQYLSRDDLRDGGRMTRVHDGPYVRTYRWTRSLEDVGSRASTLELEVTLRQGSSRVEYSLHVDWREMGHPERGIPHLRARFSLALQKPETPRGLQPRYEIPYGSVLRELVDGEQVPAQRWADLSEAGLLGMGGLGVTLVNSSKYGHSVDGNVLELALLRASIDPDPLPDIGEHTIKYALVPHGAGWTIGDCMRAGEEMNVSLVVASCSFHGGELPSAQSFVRVEPANVRLVALKGGQEGGLVLRLVEVGGRETVARVSLSRTLVPQGAEAVEVDTLERPVEGGSARLEGGTLEVTLPADGIVTVWVS
jgi:alpha-mannosidase